MGWRKRFEAVRSQNIFNSSRKSRSQESQRTAAAILIIWMPNKCLLDGEVHEGKSYTCVYHFYFSLPSQDFSQKKIVFIKLCRINMWTRSTYQFQTMFYLFRPLNVRTDLCPQRIMSTASNADSGRAVVIQKNHPFFPQGDNGSARSFFVCQLQCA